MLDAIKGKLAALRSAPTPVDALLEDIDSTREQIAVMQEQRAAVAAAPRPPEEIIGLLDDAMSAMAADALDGFGFPAMLLPGATVGLPLSQSGDARSEVNRLLGLMIALNRAPLRKMLVAQVEAAASVHPVAPLTEADRSARLAELDAAILSAELAEEGAIRRLEALGISVMRRSDLSPLVALAADDALPG